MQGVVALSRARASVTGRYLAGEQRRRGRCGRGVGLPARPAGGKSTSAQARTSELHALPSKLSGSQVGRTQLVARIAVQLFRRWTGLRLDSGLRRPRRETSIWYASTSRGQPVDRGQLSPGVRWNGRPLCFGPRLRGRVRMKRQDPRQRRREFPPEAPPGEKGLACEIKNVCVHGVERCESPKARG